MSLTRQICRAMAVALVALKPGLVSAGEQEIGPVRMASFTRSVAEAPQKDLAGLTPYTVLHVYSGDAVAVRRGEWPVAISLLGLHDTRPEAKRLLAELLK